MTPWREAGLVAATLLAGCVLVDKGDWEEWEEGRAGPGDTAQDEDLDTDQDGYSPQEGDCDDADAAVHPGATEACNGVDDDCDGDTDEDVQPTWYADSDGDGYGDPGAPTPACEQPADTSADDTDCDDTDVAVHPGAAESCNGVDDDCDGDTDEDDAADAATWYADVDADGYGDADSTTSACEQPAGFCTDDSDCDDDDGTVHPGAEDTWHDGVDSDCDGASDDDADGDGYDSDAYGGSDCDDTDPDSNPDWEGWLGADYPDDCSGASARSASDACLSVVGTDSDMVFGYDMVAADVDGSGAADLVVATASTSSDDEVMVFLDSSLGAGSNSAADYDTIIVAGGTLDADDAELLLSYGRANGYEKAPSLVSCDVDADGLGDIPAGSEWTSGSADAGGFGLTLAARVAAATTGSREPASADFAGDEAGDELGAVVQCADVNGDGSVDLVGSAPYAGGSSSNHGKVYLFLGW